MKVLEPLKYVRDPSRLAILNELSGHEKIADEVLDSIADTVQRVLRVPIAWVSVVGSGSQSFTGAAGLPEPWNTSRECPLSYSFCKYVVATAKPLIVEDTRRHPLVRSNPAIKDMGVLAYAGMPVLSREGVVLGTACAADLLPRSWVDEEQELLRKVSQVAGTVLERMRALTSAEGQVRTMGTMLRDREEALAATSYFQALVEKSLVGIYLIQEQEIRYANPQFGRIFGYDTGAVVGKPVLDFVADSDQTVVSENLRKRLEGEAESIHYTFCAKRKDGAVIEVEAHGSRIDLEGEAAVLGTLRDITETRRAERRLQKSEERFRYATRATSDVIYDWDVAAGTLLWNESAPKLFRYSAKEMGTTVDWWYERIHPEDRARVTSGMDAVVAGVSESWVAEYRFRRGDGMYATLLDRAYLVRDGRQAPLRVIGSMMDITGRKRAEEAQRFLAEASAVLDTSLVEDATFGILARLVVPTLADYCVINLVDADGGIVRAAAVHTDPAKERLLLRGRCQLEDATLQRHPVVRAIRTGTPVLVPKLTESVLDDIERHPEHREALHKLGLRSFLVVPLTVRGRTLGAITFAAAESRRHYDAVDLVLAEDLARRAAVAIDNARLYRTAQQAVSARDEVMGVVSHDLRNPLNTIQLSINMLLELQEERRTENVRWLELVRRSANQMNTMVNDLLDVSSIEAGKFSVELVACEVADLVADVRDLIAPLAEKKSLRVEYQVADDLPRVIADADQLQRVFANLIGNAVKFTGKDGRITVSAWREKNKVRFSVQDTGPGIASGQLRHVFDRFWQAREGDRRGAGLGLAIAHGIVKAHHGEIAVESPPGEGAVFSFTIPVAGGV